MKCNELMVGDWIAEIYGLPMQVVSVGKDYLYADFEGNEGNVVKFDDKSYKPYPIVLEDEFFEINDFDERILYHRKGTIVHAKSGNNGYDITIGMFDAPFASDVNVHYVHELQQLLRLGGFTELANNVKV